MTNPVSSTVASPAAATLMPSAHYPSPFTSSSSSPSPTSPSTDTTNTTGTSITPHGKPMLRQVQLPVQVRKGPAPPSWTPPPLHSHKSTKPRQVLVACAACQKRKSKCTGERPQCSLCSLKNTDCIYETRFGEARSAQLKRRVQELSLENSSLRDVVNTLRTADPAQAIDLLECIRSTKVLDEALRLIGDSALLLSVRREDSGDSMASGLGSMSSGSGSISSGSGSMSSGSSSSEEDKVPYRRVAIDDLLS